MDNFKVTKEHLPKRCEICHQSDEYNQDNKTCKRCMALKDQHHNKEFLTANLITDHHATRLKQNYFFRNKYNKNLELFITIFFAFSCFGALLFGGLGFHNIAGILLFFNMMSFTSFVGSRTLNHIIAAYRTCKNYGDIFDKTVENVIPFIAMIILTYMFVVAIYQLYYVVNNIFISS